MALEYGLQYVSKQWGKTKTSGKTSKVTLPISFPHDGLLVGYCILGTAYYYGIDDFSNNQFTIYRQWYDWSTGGNEDTLIWGIGY